MSRYNDIRTAFSEFIDAEKKYVSENEKLAHQIAFGLCEHLGCPDRYEVEENSRPREKPYIQFLELDEDEKPGKVVSGLPTQAIAHFTDGRFTFAFRIILERKENAYPKVGLSFVCKCHRVGKMVNISIGEKSLDLEFDGSTCAKIEEVHQMITDQIFDTLAQRPGDGQHVKVGFFLR